MSKQDIGIDEKAFKETIERLKKSAEKLEEEFRALAKKIDEDRKKMMSQS